MDNKPSSDNGGRAKEETHIFCADTPPRIVNQAFVEQVEAIGARCCEEITQGRLGELSDWNVVRELGMSLVTVSAVTCQWYDGAHTGQSSSVGVPSARKIVLS